MASVSYYDSKRNMQRNPRKYTVADVLWDRETWRQYYDGLEAISDRRLDDAERSFREALRLNPGFPGSYEGLAVVAKQKGNEAEARKLTTLAFEKVIAAYPKWPRRLSWGEIENRPVLRVIQLQAMLHHKDGNRTEAEQLYDLLPKLNPSDNQGIRYLLADLRKRLPPG